MCSFARCLWLWHRRSVHARCGQQSCSCHVQRRYVSQHINTAAASPLFRHAARFADDPKLLAVEWEDGVPPSQFVTPARDAVLAALLGAAQAAGGRPIAVMPGEAARLLAQCIPRLM